MPRELEAHVLAELWHCTPSQAREEDEVDVQLAAVLKRTRDQYERDQAYFSSP